MTQRRTTRRTFIVLLAASLSGGWPAAAQTPAVQTRAPRPIVILGVPAEVKDIEAQLTRATIERVQGVPFTVGVIGSTRVVLGKTNAGKVNAAMMTTLAVNHYSPSAVFFTGTAGAVDPELKPGDVVLGTAIGYHDFGAATPGGFVRRATNNPATGGVNPAFFTPDERLVSAARRLAPAQQERHRVHDDLTESQPGVALFVNGTTRHIGSFSWPGDRRRGSAAPAPAHVPFNPTAWPGKPA